MKSFVLPVIEVAAQPEAEPTNRQARLMQRLRFQGGKRIPFNLLPASIEDIRSIVERDELENATEAVVLALHSYARVNRT